eukprot:TRINITY_DN27328_c0_g1_i1.p1 TRINITY_DN27328_c0_g1~~TRINITY_DN27328_c0_g1_i1.p1  ORF type:complete len:650 (-),score=120.74 TRINITY_DN27328_c0_g1_i1:37-1962(-)
MGACLAAFLDGSCCEGHIHHFYVKDDSSADVGEDGSPSLAALFRSRSASAPADSDSEEEPDQIARSRTWSVLTAGARKQSKRMKRLFMPKHTSAQVTAELMHFGTQDRINNIMNSFKVRGAHRPITDFYEKVADVGTGAFGTVSRWKHRDAREADNEVAVKQIGWQKIWHGFFRQRNAEAEIRNELKLLLVLDHPFIIRFREWFEDACHGIYFVMEICKGPSLQAILEEVAALPSLAERKALLPRLRRYFREITYAISYIHSMQPPVLHRDLKPDNVLLKEEDPKSTVKLIDFGLASLEEDHYAGETAVGTMVFMAPESFLEKRVKYSEATDNWALGVILTWIMTTVQLGSQQHPMLDRALGKDFEVGFYTLYMAFKDRAPWNRSLLGEHHEEVLGVCDILDKVLVYNPSDRMKAAQILESEWIKVNDPAASDCAELLRKGHISQNIHTYAELSKFDRTVLSLIADHAPDVHVQQLRRTFRALDVSMNGRISRQELIDGFKRHDVEVDEDCVKELFKVVDTDRDAGIGYHEWLAATIGTTILKSEKAISAAFRRLDPNMKGVIRKSDLKRSLGKAGAEDFHKSLDVEEEKGISPTGLSPLAGTPGIDEIDYDAFKRLVHKVSTRRSSVLQKVIVEGGAAQT